jgi:hypothetical protein
MVEVKQMPYTEKYTRVLNGLKHDEYVPAFIEKHLGPAAAAEYRERRDAAMQPIPDDASDQVKYEMAYKNWMSGASTAFGFVRERMGDEGIDQMVKTGAEALIRENANPSLVFLRLIRAISPGTAFEMVGKKSAYEMQYLTDYSVDELDKHKAVMNVPRCKILDYPGTEDVCLVGCQREWPQWLAEQLHVKMETDRRGNSCTITLSPLS